MAELLKNHGLEHYVEEPIFDFGTVGPQDVIPYEFPFKGTEDDIQYVEKGCGCTSALFKDGKIQGQLDMAKASGRGYSDGETGVTKYVFVYLNDGEDRFSADEYKQKVVNQDKKFFKLMITGKVLV